MTRTAPGARVRAGARCLAASLALLLCGCAAAPLPPAQAPWQPGSEADSRVAAPAPALGAIDPQLDAAARAHPVAFLDRIGWGANAAQLRELDRLGATRLLDAQLRPDPEPELPDAVARRLAALPVNAPLEQLIPPLVEARRANRADAREQGGGGLDAARAVQAQRKVLQERGNALTQQAMAQHVLLAVYAPNQLQQRLTWFWMNHFNVFRGPLTGPMMADYERRVVGPRALGRFRDLLEATMFSPQMLVYLNNAQNARGHINENDARELMELHTLGVGSGYTQADVTALAHVLSGLGVDLTGRPVRVGRAWRDRVWQRGLVVFNPARHDPQPEVVLGRTLQGDDVGEIEQVITLLARDPATARHVSLELAQDFAADRPDPAMVDAMVRTWARTDGDIAAVVRTMVTSPQFAAGLSQPQFKDPMRYVLSAARVTLDSGSATISNPQPLLGMLDELAEPLYGRQTPDGYPVVAQAWNGPSQLTTRFQIAQRFAVGVPALFGPPPPYLGDGAPAGMQDRGPAAPVPDLSRGAVFLAAAPDLRPATVRVLEQARGRARWNALWLASPDFMNM